MKKLFALVAVVMLFTGCSNLSPEQKEKVVDLIIKGIDIAEQCYVADKATDGRSFTVSAATNGSIEHQICLAYKLSKMDGSKAFEGGNTYATELKHFVVKMVELQANGATTTPLRIKYAKVDDGVIEELMFSLLQEDGELIDETCVNCCLF